MAKLTTVAAAGGSGPAIDSACALDGGLGTKLGVEVGALGAGIGAHGIDRLVLTLGGDLSVDNGSGDTVAHCRAHMQRRRKSTQQPVSVSLVPVASLADMPFGPEQCCQPE